LVITSETVCNIFSDKKEYKEWQAKLTPPNTYAKQSLGRYVPLCIITNTKSIETLLAKQPSPSKLITRECQFSSFLTKSVTKAFKGRRCNYVLKKSFTKLKKRFMISKSLCRDIFPSQNHKCSFSLSPFSLLTLVSLSNNLYTYLFI